MKKITTMGPAPYTAWAFRLALGRSSLTINLSAPSRQHWISPPSTLLVVLWASLATTFPRSATVFLRRFPIQGVRHRVDPRNANSQ